MTGIETEDEPLTLPPLEWGYHEDPEPSWRAEKYVIRVCASELSPEHPKLVLSPYEVKFGQSKTWHARTLVKAKDIAEKDRLQHERLQRERRRRGF
jgi:hypothetical protein